MKKLRQRSLAAVLIVALLASTLGIVHSIAAEKIRIANWPAIMGFTAGTKPIIEGWEFNMKDYGEKAKMQVSDPDFKAPNVTWDANDNVPTFSWDAISGAARYDINVYEGTALVKTYSATENSFAAAQNNTIPAGVDYEVQVVAYGADDSKVSASCIRKFTAEATPDYDYTILDFNDEATNKNLKKYYRGPSYNKTEDGRLYLNYSGDAIFTFFNMPKMKMDNAAAIVFKIGTDIPYAGNLTPAFGVSADVTSDVTGDSYTAIIDRNSKFKMATIHGTVIAVPASDPTKYQSKATLGKNEWRGINVPQTIAEDPNGYYLVFPLSLFTENVQKDIKAGIFDVIGFQDFPNGTKIKKNGTWVDGKGASLVMNFDEIFYITDTNGWLTQLQQNYDAEAYEKNTSYVFEGDLGVIEADSFNANQNQLSSDKFTSYYKFQNDNAARRLTFMAVSKFTNQYGANLSFTAPATGYYDLANKFEVVNNDSITDATVYYRVVKKATDGTVTTVYPFDTTNGEWDGLVVSADNKNPVGNIGAPMVKLNANEQLIIETYADITNGGQLEINLGNPTVTKVGHSETYKGSSYVWSYGDYVPNFVYDGAINNNSLHQTGRWAEKFLRIDAETGAESYDDFTNHLISWGMTGKPSQPAMGYYYYTDTTRGQEMKLQPGIDDYGLAFQFTSPLSGGAVISFDGKGELKFRILVNGTKVWPTDNSWQIGTSFSQAVEVSEGDIISIEMMKTANSGGNITCTSPRIIMNTGNVSNTVGDHTYAPLWERPYDGKNYTGDFAAITGNVWTFNTADYSSATSVKTFASNYYDKGTLYYKNEEGVKSPDAEYIFTKEQLKAKIGTANHGIALTFTAPALGYYDFSTAINVLDGTFNASNGTGTLKARVLAAGDIVWPETGDWYTSEKIKAGESIPITATEVNLNAGEELVLQVYASKLTNADGEGDLSVPDPMVVGFASPAVQHIGTRIFTESGSETVYTPVDFSAFENGYSGTYIPVDSRFNINIGGKTPISVNSANATLTVDKNNKIVYDTKNGKLKLTVAKGNTAIVEFTSPMDGSGKYQVNTPEISGITYRLLKNGEVVEKFAAKLPESIDLTAKKGDKFTLEIKATAKATVTFDAFNISLKGMHNNPNKAGDTAFYAPFAVPYKNDDYTGKYTESENGYWKFNLYDVNTDTVKKANYYDYTNKKKLYNTDMQNVGYYFVEQNNRMTADIYTSDTEKYGLSLGFAAPAAGIFNFRSGLQLETDTNATMMLRLIQKTADGTVTTIWPANTDADGWYEETVTQNKDIAIPHAEVKFAEGDTVYLQIYAKDSETSNLNISLASPGFMVDSPVTIEHADIGARIYDCTHYNPYKHFKHKGEFITYDYVPMENRWNLEYISIDPETGEMVGMVNPDYYRIGTSGAHELMYKGYNGLLWLNYHSNKTPMAIGRYTENNQNHYQYIGSQKRFIAPSTASYQIKGVTPSAKEVIEGGSIRYRITKISATTGEESVVWPSQEAIDAKTTVIWESSDGTAWEVLNSENLVSKAEEFELSLEVGDQLKFQAYSYATPADLDTYVATLPDTEKKKWSPVANVAPQIIVIDYINEKSIHTLNTGWMHDYQLSPYWKIQSADGEGQPYRDNVRYSWNYWLDTKYSLIGISALQKWNFQKYKENTWTDEITPIISTRFTFSSDGYLTTKGTAKFIGDYFVDEAQTEAVNIKARIILNGQNLYPDSGWSNITNGTTFDYDIKNIEVKKGDELRYELMYDNGGQNVYITWNPSLTINKYKDVYNFTDDIYNMLTDEMTTHYKSLDGSRPFEPLSPESLKLSEAIIARKEAAEEIGPDYLQNLPNEDEDDNVGTDPTPEPEEPQDNPSQEENTSQNTGSIGEEESGDNSTNESQNVGSINSENDEDDQDDDDDDETTIIPGESGDYREWIEEIYKPGGGYRKIIRRYSTVWWVYALIIAGCVAAAGGITVLTIVLVKKKRKKSAKKDKT